MVGFGCIEGEFELVFEFTRGFSICCRSWEAVGLGLDVATGVEVAPGRGIGVRASSRRW